MQSLGQYQQKILQYMGQPRGEVSKDLKKLLQKAFTTVSQQVEPKMAWKRFERKEIEGIIQGERLKSHLKGASHIVVFAVTLGDTMEVLIERGKRRSALEGLVYEAIGSVYVEEAVEDLRAKLHQEWTGVGTSFSPGYGDSPLTLHPEILKLADPENRLSVHVTDYHLLIPRKTITGFIPLGDEKIQEEKKTEESEKCMECNLWEECLYKNEPIILFDGALGTELQRQGFSEVENLAILNLTHPQQVLEAHKAYVDAGAEYLTTNTFSVNRLKIASREQRRKIIQAGIELAKKAKPKKVFLDIGPLGVLMKPQGEVPFEEAYEHFQETIKLGAKEGIDGILFETFTDLYEIKAAIYAAKESTDLPIYATMSFEKDGRTYLGLEPKVALRALEAFGADVVGINCSVGPEEMIPWIRESIPYLTKPLMIQGNAGLPIYYKGEDHYPLSPTDYASYTQSLVELGVKIIGGCCGTRPKTIEAVKRELSGQVYCPPKRGERLPFACSYNEGVFIKSSVIVGERINPTGKPAIEQALRSRDYSSIVQEAVLQKKEGAEILDVNVGLSDIKEELVLPEVIESLQQVVSIPLQIDTSDAKALEKTLRIYNGVPIINSVNGTESSLQNILPLGKKYGCSVIALTFDEKGIPKTAEKRVEIAKRIIHRANTLGIPKERIIVDPLALTVAHEASQVKESLKALKIIKQTLGCTTILGLSNVSYGMPNRSRINQSFLTLALYEGLDLLMMDPGDKGMKEALASFKLLSDQDPQGKSFTDLFGSKTEKAQHHESGIATWESLLRDGDPREFQRALTDWVKTHPDTLKNYEKFLEQELLQAFDQIGFLYDRGEIYLPQLIQSAEVLKSGIEWINEEIPNSGSEKKGKILLATVEGDLHDIGKNIFRVLVENYGYPVKDLGKDVKAEKILEALKNDEYSVVGLSALMTTTLGSMEKAIEAIKTAHPRCKVIVGGAVLTEAYAKKIGADAYAKDARAGVRWMKALN